MVKICPVCGGTQVGCPTCDAPPKRELPKHLVYNRVYSTLFGAAYWEVQGIDVSAWNGIMDFSITKTKCQFVIVRLGYGNGWKDKRCDEYRRNLIANNIPYGVYWYNKVGEDAVIHAESFAEVAAEFPFQMNYEEDFEQTTLDKTGTFNWIVKYDTKLKSLVNKKTSPYSNANFWNNNVAPNTYFTDEQWAANWTTRDTPFMPIGWVWKQGCKWQWSANGNRKAKEYGMIADGDQDIDLNRYYGTCAQFNARFGTNIKPIGEVVEPPLPPGTVPEKVIVNTGEVNFRHSPDPLAQNICGSSKAGMYLYPEAIEKDQFGKEWYKLGKKIFVKKELTRVP